MFSSLTYSLYSATCVVPAAVLAAVPAGVPAAVPAAVPAGVPAAVSFQEGMITQVWCAPQHVLRVCADLNRYFAAVLAPWQVDLTFEATNLTATNASLLLTATITYVRARSPPIMLSAPASASRTKSPESCSPRVCLLPSACQVHVSRPGLSAVCHRARRHQLGREHHPARVPVPGRGTRPLRAPWCVQAIERICTSMTHAQAQAHAHARAHAHAHAHVHAHTHTHSRSFARIPAPTNSILMPRLRCSGWSDDVGRTGGLQAPWLLVRQ